ncbi:MAG: acetolactate synthase small subunit [Thermodesulfobacteriota bacterium]
MRKMISILVRNQPGVLSHVAGLVTRRGYNVESISAGVTEDPAVTRITLIVAGDEQVLEQVTKQMRKLIDVIKVQDLKYSESITRELVLMTIYVPREKRQEIIALASGFGAKVVDIADKTMTLEFSGNMIQVNTILEALSGFQIKTLGRTGVVALPLESRLEQGATLL